MLILVVSCELLFPDVQIIGKMYEVVGAIDGDMNVQQDDTALSNSSVRDDCEESQSAVVEPVCPKVMVH